MKHFIISGFFGLLALGLVNFCGAYTGVTLPVSTLSVGIASVLGVPGVTTMVLLDFIL